MGATSLTPRLTAFLLDKRQQSVAKGQVIQSSDAASKVYLITSGYVKKYMIKNDGTLSIMIIYGPHEIFPLTIPYRTLFHQELYEGPEVYYYEAMTSVTMHAVDRAELITVISQDGSMYKDLFSEAGRRLLYSIQQLENMALPNFYKRVAHQLVYFGHYFGEQSSKGVKIKLPLTQQDLADVLSATRETVSLSMNQLRQRRLIRPGRDIIIPDINKLRAEAYN